MKILFISHDASRTGAPISLLHIIKWFKTHTDFECINLLGRGGPMLDEFKELGETFIFEDIAKERMPWMQSTFGKDPLRMLSYKLFLNKIEKFDPQLIYANSVASVEVLRAIKNKFDLPVLLHVHELEISIKQYAGENKFRQIIPYVDQYIAASQIVKNNLIKNYKIEGQKIEVFYEPVDIQKMNYSGFDYSQNVDTKKSLGFPEDAFLVCGCGTTEWRKSPDIFVQIAAICNKISKIPIHFVWMGGYINDLEHHKLQYDIDRLGLSSLVKFIGSQNDVKKIFAISNLFLLTSREDPFPLVCLEANAMMLPVLCFKDAGGMPEYIINGGGEVVDYLDINAMANQVIAYSLKTEIELDELKSKIMNNIKALDIHERGKEIKLILEKMLTY